MFCEIVLLMQLLTAVTMYRDYSSPYNDPCGSSSTQVHDGDIAYYLTPNTDHRAKRGAISIRERLWPGGKIPFEISPGFYERERMQIYEAMRVWENCTCIRFYERPEDHNESYINFFRGGCCASYVGRQTVDLQQGISLGSSCNKFSTYLHEIGHAIGFWHEQSRPDRDWYIRVLMENVIPTSRNNFHIVEQINSLGIGYDYNSIMHYSSTAFNRNDRPTMEAHDPSIPLGGAVDLSELDILQTNLLYQCDKHNLPPTMLPPPPPPPNDTKPPLPPCGQEFTEYEGFIFSPGYPSTYPPNQTCGYRIYLPKGMILTIVIADFLMDWTQHCTADSLTIYKKIDGSGYPEFSRCGASYTNFTLHIDGSVAYIKFTSNGDNVYRGMRGFAIYYKGEDINECQTDNGGCSQTCVNLVPGYQCLCNKGWFLSADDHTCFDMNECAVGNGGCQHKCNNTGGSFSCMCLNGSTLHPNGKACSNPGAMCSTDNGGCDHICRETSGGVICLCESGYRLDRDGVTCTDIDECRENNTCGYGACRNTAGSCTCICERGYEMDNETSRCINVDECLQNIHLCRGGSQCQDTEGAYECVCGEGYKSQLDGMFWTCIDNDECVLNPAVCSNITGSVCLNTPGSYKCICSPGFIVLGGTCGVSDINECEEDVCSHITGAVCHNTPGSFECNCSHGYWLNGSVCEDIDECTLYPEGCSHIEGAICHNTPGCHECICSPGFNLSKSTCEDINECEEDVCSHITGAVCHNTPGSFECNCSHGYWLNGSICEDIDECTLYPEECSHIEGAICHNTPGSHECICSPGFNLSESACEDINECEEDVCSHITGAVCHNTPGSFECNCSHGYWLNGSICEDIDECTLYPEECSHIEGAICHNTPGSHECICSPGFNLSESACEGINECEEDVCSHITGGAVCHNTPGSFECNCSHGYWLNGSVCEDIDECTLYPGGCSHIEGAICHNTPGSHECICSPGFNLSESACEDINECEEDVCSHITGGAVCHNTPGSFECNCSHGYWLNGSICEDINECSEEVHTCEHECLNTNGSYICTCQTGYMLGPDGQSCQCGGIFEGDMGTFSTPGWPYSYPMEDFVCTWIINNTTPNTTIHFMINESAYGINGRHPCPWDYIEFFDGIVEDAETMHKLCKFDIPSEPIITSSSQAKVVFKGTRRSNRPRSRVGVQVIYRILTDRI